MSIVENQISEDLIEEFSALLADKTGLYFPKERWGELEKKLTPILHASGCKDMPACIRWLSKNLIRHQYIPELAYHLTIGETYFFRDARLFTALEQEILPEIIQRHQTDRRIRIWSAGCCTGEEPYSIAILLHRLLPDIANWDIHLMGTDINPAFLFKAQQGRYGKWSFRTTAPEILRRYFTHGHHGYQLVPEIRQMVTFTSMNLVEPIGSEQSDARQDTDLILCNNVLIYFSRTQVVNTIKRLANALIKDGWLSVTAIEAPFIDHHQLKACNVQGAVLFKKEAQTQEVVEKIQRPHVPVAQIPPPPSIPTPKLEDEDAILMKVVLPAFLNTANPVLEYRFMAPEVRPSLPEPVEQAISSYDACVQLFKQKHYEQAVVELLAELSKHRDDPIALQTKRRELYLLIRTYANQGKLLEALDWCHGALKADKLDPILHYLHAEIEFSRGSIPLALEAIKRAIFLNPDFIMAYHLLGLLELAQQNTKNSNKAFQTALELIKQHAAEDILPGTEETTAGHVQDHLQTLLRRP